MILPPSTMASPKLPGRDGRFDGDVERSGAKAVCRNDFCTGFDESGNSLGVGGGFETARLWGLEEGFVFLGGVPIFALAAQASNHASTSFLNQPTAPPLKGNDFGKSSAYRGDFLSMRS